MNAPVVIPGVYTTVAQGPKGFELKTELAAHLEPIWERPIHGNVVVVASLDDAKWQTTSEGDSHEDATRGPDPGG